MAQTGITTILQDSVLGVNTADDSISMLFSPAVAVSADSENGITGFNLNTPYLLTSVADATPLGLNAAYDTTNKVAVYQQISEFYEGAPAGTKLWLCGIAIQESGAYYGEDASSVVDFQSIILQTKASSTDYRPRMIGLCYDTAFNNTTGSATLNPDVFAAIENWGTIQSALFNESTRFTVIIDGANMKEGTTLTMLPDLSTYANGAIGVAITGSKPNGVSSVGRLMGICAARGLAVSPGDVSYGPVSQTDYFTDGWLGSGSGDAVTPTLVNTTTKGTFDSLGEKQYLFTRTRGNKGGLYYNDGATCNDAMMSLSTIQNSRVGNAVCDDAEDFTMNMIETNIPVDSSGHIQSDYIASQSAQFYNQYASQRIQNGEASNIIYSFEEVAPTFVESKQIKVTVQIQPMTPLREATIYTFFVASY